RNPEQGAKALARAVAIAREQNGAPPPELLVDYGEALAEAAGGVSDEAEAIFKEAVAEDPKQYFARYYLGLALAGRGDKPGALKAWQDLLKDAPPEWPPRDRLIDQVAALTAEHGAGPGGGAPNPAEMVARLENELEANPNNLPGWVRLIKV